MGNFKITGPDGKSYRISGDTPEGAMEALKKHLASKPGPEGVAPGDTFGAQDLAVPSPPDALAVATTPAPDTKPAALPEESPGTIPGAVKPMDRVPTAMRLDPKVAPIDGAPVLKDDPLFGAMMPPAPAPVSIGDDNRLVAITRKLADPNLTPDTRASLEAQLAGIMKRPNEAGVPGPDLAPEAAPDPLSKTYTPLGEAILSELGNVPERLRRGFAGNELLTAEMRQRNTLERIGIAKDLADPTDEIAAADRELAQINAKLIDPSLRGDGETTMSLSDDLAKARERRAMIDTAEGRTDATIDTARKNFEAAQAKRKDAQGRIDAAEATMVPTNPAPGLDQALVSGIASFGDMAPGLATTLVSKNPLPMLIYLGAYSRGSTYADKRQAGVPSTKAAPAADLYALAEAIPEMVPLHVILEGGRGALSKIVGGAVTEAASEAVTSGLQTMIDVGLLDKNTTWGEAIEAAKVSAEAGGVMGGMMGAGAVVYEAGANAAQRRKAAKGSPADPNANPPLPNLSRKPVVLPPAPPVDPLVAAMTGQDPLTLTPDMRKDVPPVVPKQDAKPVVSDKPSKPDQNAKSDAIPKGEFEVMDEVETVDGETRPTGRKVRVNLNTGDAEVVEDSEIGGEQTPAGAGGAAAKATPEEGKQAAPEGSPVPSAEPSPVESDKEFVGDRPPPVRKFLTSEETLAIKTNPKVLQYKSNSDAEGVTDALRNIKTFDPNRAGQVVLFERKDGTLEVADGHQRAGLARRAAAAGQADVGGTAATVYREADGYTADEVMGLAALKNIGEGSGTAVDAARILRTRPETIQDLGLPPNSALVRKADGIRRLSDDAFGMVANGVASEEYGDVVGRNVTDKAMQSDILAMLTRMKPDNLAQAAMIARDAAADASTETQTDMFGTMQVQKSLYVERAKVLDAAMKSQGILAKTFRNLVEREGVITKAGNQLDTKANAALVDEAGQVRQYLQAQANMKGAISDALSKAAEAVRSGSPVARAAEGFVRDVKASLQGPGEGGPQSAPAGAGNEGRAKDDNPAVTPARNAEDDLFVAMGGIPAQTGKAPARVRAEAEVKVKAAQSRIGTTKPQDAAGPLFDDQADIEKIAAKPAPQPQGPIAAGRKMLARHEKPTDQAFDRLSGVDLRDTADGRALDALLAGAKTTEEREQIADDFVLRKGRETGIEHLVAMLKDGSVVAIMSGHVSGVSFHSAVWRATAAGEVDYFTHNHPSSNSFSAADLTILAIGARKIAAIGHDGKRHVALRRDGAMPRTPELFQDAKGFRSYSETLEQLLGNVSSQMSRASWEFDSYKANPVGVPPEWERAVRGAASLVLDRMGLIDYTGLTIAEIEADGFNFGEIYGRAASTFADRLRRAGFVVDERGIPQGDRATGGGAEAAPPASDRPDQGAAKPDASGDGKRIPAPADDFDAAASSVLDDLFGDEKAPAVTTPRKRSDAEIAKDLGGLFNEDAAEFEADTYARAAPLFAETLAGQDVRAQPIIDTIRAIALRFKGQGLTREGIERMLPYLKLYLQDVQAGNLPNPVEDANVSGADGRVEPDRGDAGPGDRVGEADVQPARGRPGSGRSGRGVAPGDGDGQRNPGSGVPDGDAASVGTEGNPPLEGRVRGESGPALDRDSAGSSDSGEQGPAPDSRDAAHTERYAVDRAPAAAAERLALQAEADRLTKRDGVKLADEANVRQSLPLLKPEQQDDVIKIETRLAKPDGHGMLLTNGTGTGKTWSAGGAVKRFVQAGKTNILIAAPSQGILDHWAGALADMGITSSRLEGLKDMGQGVTLTTYANLGENETLADREFDLVVTDEAHKLSQNADGDATSALRTLRAITNHPRGRQDAARMRRRAEWAKAEAMPDGDAKTAALNRLFDLMRKEAEAMGDKSRAKALFLSATPFAYVKNTDYAEGYLFDYPADGHVGRSRQSGQNLFMVENFGYRIRYHKLTQPDVGVDTGVFEREFHEKLRRQGVLSGRMLDIDADYDRRFVLSEDKEGAKIDGVLQFIRDQANAKGDDARQREYRALQQSLKSTFNHLKQMQLLEAIKAQKAIPDIEAHLKLGRKVVVFHDYNVGGGFNPFRPTVDGDKGIIPTAEANAGYARLIRERPEVEDLNFTGYPPPVEVLKKHFGNRAAIYNGTVPQKVRKADKARFQKDGSGLDLIIVQSAAGEAGIDLHDTTGAHQRAMINLGMPSRPTTALQEEGRTRREGSVTDSPFRYYTIGTAWERRAFAKKIAERSGTVENLALGDMARTIKDSFVEAYSDAEPIKPAPGDGKGGKERDRAQAKASPYEVAKTHYYGRMKITGRRDQREGIDFYSTAEPLAFKMVEWAGIRAYEKALEPSVGDGAIARYLPEHARRTLIEPSMDLLSKAELRAAGSTAVNRTFEDYHIANKHHAIVMNPPFGSGGATAIAHLAKAMQHLKPGGRVVALIPTGPAADKRFEAMMRTDAAKGMWIRSIVTLPAVTFEKAGTNVMTRVVVIDKITVEEMSLAPNTFINLTGAETISQLFDRMQDISVPARAPMRTDPTEEFETEVDEDGEPIGIIKMTPPPTKLGRPVAEALGGFKLAQTKHGKTGAPLFVATAENRVERDAYAAALAVAKQHGGWYSSFRGNGAVPGFQFKSEAQRQAFLDDMAKPTIGLNEDPVSFTERDQRPDFPDVDDVALAVDAQMATKNMLAIMPELRKELDRLHLKRVKLYFDPMADWQGRFEMDAPNNYIAILIGASHNPWSALHHEVIHALYHSNLFTPEEWAALQKAAIRGKWMEKYDIRSRYPELTYVEQLEEAIAEEFGEVYARRQPVPKASGVIAAFNKIVRFLKAALGASRAAGFQTADDVFGRALSGEIGARFRQNGTESTTTVRSQKVRLPSKQARAHMATPMGGQHLHIPDRNVWQELSRAGAPIWQRLDGGAGAASDTVDRARVVIQDRMLPLRRGQVEIEKRRGSPLPASMDAYTVETTFSGKVGRHLFEIDEDFTKPIVSLIAKTKGRLTAENVGTWLYARHAIERNARIASINPRMPDGGSGMTNAEATQILQDAARSPDAAILNQVGTLIDQLREKTLLLRQSKGLITAAEANRWRTQYQHYVPLKGWADTDHSDAMLDVSGVGRRFNTRGQEARRALGRASEAFNPLQAAITQAQEVAIRAEKNAVGQATLELAKAYPSPALWSVKQVKMKQVFNRTTGLVELRPEDPLTLFMDPNEMSVKVAGQEYRIMFHDPRLARALGQVGADQMNMAIQLVAIGSRYFSMTRTMMNPEFVIANAIRDFETAQFGIQSFGINPKTKADNRNAIAIAMAANWRKALAGVYRGLGNKADTTWSKHFKEFQQAGANISFWNMDQPEAGLRDIDKRIDLARGSRAARALKHFRPSAVFSMRDNPALAFIERANLAVDNAIRLAAFVKARELGWDVQDAAFLAKELTVNFNRRGEITGTAAAFYPFINASIQGTVRMVQAFASPRGARRVAIMAAISMVVGYLNDLFNAWLSDEDDDGELIYDKIEEFESQRNMQFVLGGTGANSLAIPMAYGWGMFPYIGQQIGKWQRGVKTADQAFGDVVAAAFQSFAPINGGSVATTVSPYFTDPFVELIENRNFFGGYINPEPEYMKDGVNDSQAYFPSNSLVARWTADALNALTGGDFRQPGLIDVHPGTLDHLTAYVFGSAGAFWGRGADIIAKVITRKTDEIKANNIPFLRVLTTQVSPWIDKDRFKQFGADVIDKHADAKAYTAAGMKVPDDVAALAALYEDLNAAKREIKGQGEWNQSKEGALTARDERAVWLDFSKKYLKVTRAQVSE